MTFNEAYRELEEEFRRRVDDDYQQWEFESVYLPNIAPMAPVDYVLIAMEPSLRGWAKDFPGAKKKIKLGFRNFCGVWQLHYPVGKYLCRDEETFYLTDLAKGAMATGSPGAANEDKYEAWYSLLERELGLVAKPDAKIISIGGRVGSFLSKKGLYGHVGTIPHYSGQAAGHWGQERVGRAGEFRRFRSEVGTIPTWTHTHTTSRVTQATSTSRFRPPKPRSNCSSTVRCGSSASGSRSGQDGDSSNWNGNAV